MKNLKLIEKYWRDDPRQLCIYATCLGIIVSIMLYQLHIISRLALIDSLQQDDTVSLQAMSSRGLVMNTQCAWIKASNVWRINGSFSFVYDCLLHSVPDHTHVLSMLFWQQVQGVSATITWKESES